MKIIPFSAMTAASLWAGMVVADATPVARYQVKYLAPDRFGIDAEFSRPTRRFDLNDRPSLERPLGESASIVEVQAFDRNGQPAAIDFVGEGTWMLQQQPATRIHYEVLADHDSVTWVAGKEETASRFDNSFYFVGDAFFLIDYDWPQGEIHIVFDLPAGWHVTAPWRVDGNRAVVASPEELGNNAFAIGSDESRASDTGGLRLTWLADSRVASANAELSSLFERLPAAYNEFWGGNPGSALSIFVLADSATDGGAFKNSFAMRLDTPLRATERPIWMHTMAHELMHIWMNQANDGIGRAMGGSHYWFTEGFTDYLTIKLMRQAGLLDRDMAAQRIANLIRRYQISRKISPGIGMMAGGERKHDNWELVYGGGAMVALLLDAELSQQSPNAFRDVLRRLQHQGGQPMNGNDLLAELNAGSNGQAGTLLKRLDEGMPLSEIRKRLAAVGIGVEGFSADEVYVEFASCREDICIDIFAPVGQPPK